MIATETTYVHEWRLRAMTVSDLRAAWLALSVLHSEWRLFSPPFADKIGPALTVVMAELERRREEDKLDYPIEG